MIRAAQTKGHPLYADWLALSRQANQKYQGKIDADPAKRLAYLEKRKAKRKAADSPERRAAAVRRAQAWTAANPEKSYAAKLQRNYGLSYAAYCALVESQGAKCAICNAALESGRTRRSASVDHCHQSGIVRGILCQSCNFAIGHMDDDPGRLEAAAAYLRKHGK